MGGNGKQNEILTERRSFQLTGTSLASLVGTTNTAVTAFNGVLGTAAFTLKAGTVYNVGTTHVAPPALSSIWCNVVNSAAFGTTMKFTQRGLYAFDVFLPLLAGVDIATAALMLDGAAATYLAASTLLPTTANPLGGSNVTVYAFNQTQQSDHIIGANMTGHIPITDALAGGAQAAAASGAQGVGVVRLHLDNGSDTAPTLYDNTLITLMCTSLGDLAG